MQMVRRKETRLRNIVLSHLHQMKRTALRKMSRSKAREHRKYILAKARALPGKVCEFPGSTCTNQADDIHHSNRRSGKMLNDQKFWWFLCRAHHRWVEDNKKEARKMGLITYK